jgi:hypothetical protein
VKETFATGKAAEPVPPPAVNVVATNQPLNRTNSVSVPSTTVVTNALKTSP